MRRILILQGHPDATAPIILGFVGFAPVRETLIGSVETLDADDCRKWFTRLEKVGAKAE